MSGHTPGKLAAKLQTANFRSGRQVVALRIGDQAIATMVGLNADKANARRFVACWNACADLTTEQIEDGVVVKLREDRDQLLAALKSARCECSVAERDSGHLVGCWKPEADELIAKVRA